MSEWIKIGKNGKTHFPEAPGDASAAIVEEWKRGFHNAMSWQGSRNGWWSWGKGYPKGR